VVSRVVDGDTVEVSTGQTIRVIGVETPEVGQPCYAGGRGGSPCCRAGPTCDTDARGTRRR
jgi:endonuclease YncB( thermonuclease family)